MSAKLLLVAMVLAIVSIAIAGWITSAVRWATARPRRAR
jgi:hypothetical protein